ncbi:dipeptidase [Oryzibacter oryziterrae]|uniref:dipeptidase n=1 Tax=Oryzibacter oryziterrae TaxID=2766474 RepID=UPI001F446CC5|nr:dipeptidase [Oryzibacter oryziterrae]
MSLSAVLTRIDADLQSSLDRLFDLLRIPSISADPAYKADCARAADWLAAELTGIGFDTTVRPTPGHPMVVGHYTKAGPDKPHVLFYGHYDVQPVDPLELWDTPPFEPSIATMPNGTKRILARGAEDDKGQMMTFVEACRAYVAVTGALPLNVTILAEGEEESGSPSLVPFLEANKAELSKQVAMICDTDMWNRDTPAIACMLRGLVGEEFTISCADRDLHSGMFGGAALNPIHVLTKILAGLHDETGKVTLPGFYDGVIDIPADLRANWDNLGFDGAAFLKDVGLTAPAGEVDRTVLEKIWARPTCEVNGIVGGYAGDGFKTVLPAKATAKVSFRLVGKQDPVKLRAALRKYVKDSLPPSASVTFHEHGGSPAVQLPFDSRELAAARAALTEEWGKPAAITGSGGSIPIAGYFRHILGMDALMIGFGLPDDRIHSPNEKYELQSFHKGMRSWARILTALAG